MYSREKGAKLNLSDLSDVFLANTTMSVLYNTTGHDKNDMIVR